LVVVGALSAGPYRTVTNIEAAREFCIPDVASSFRLDVGRSHRRPTSVHRPPSRFHRDRPAGMVEP
jgi:hypothetical protein